ncbi:MAG: hypothetical protein H6712_22905 [Myxococcales bacterium]|nr:hypothetical protein [Myxococcales bacterium]MCB9716725.1 hypothetical protein [Myxococcales bacterium]
MCEATACAHDHDPDQLEWWPVELSDAELDAMSAFYDRLEAESPQLDRAAAERADALLVDAMKRHIGEIMDGSVLSHYCHLVNGWGNATLRGHRLLEGLASFCRPDADGRPYLEQFDRDGDFHPGQTLAYAAMAGADLDHEIPGLGSSLRELYRRSRTIKTDDGAEMGHLLFALAHLGVAPGTTFELPGRRVDVEGLMELAIAGHHHGHFKVCRKVHLSEGICAAAAMIPGLERYRPQAQAFLDGQLDLMLLLALVLERVADPERVEQDTAPDGLVTALRDTLAVAPHFEDHVFLAGHYLELAVLAGSMGFAISPAHRNAMILVANAIDRALPAWLPRSPFPEQFLFYGHYRRAITLLRAYLDDPASIRDDARRAGFTVDFDAVDALAPSPVAPEVPAAFASAGSTALRPELAAVIEALTATMPAELAPRGFRPHFRHLQPATWPHGIHYEVLDYFDMEPVITLEIHLESEAVRPVRDTLAELLPTVEALFPEARLVDWQPSWGRDRGRLRVALPDSTPPAEIAAAMQRLIEHTRGPIDAALDRLRAQGTELGLHRLELFAVA